MPIGYALGLVVLAVLIMVFIGLLTRDLIDHYHNKKRIQAIIQQHFPFEPLPNGRHRLDKKQGGYHYQPRRAFT